ncbi:MAG: flagellar motor switch protein FliN, partial [Firmicutes bacterium]|nr:flagellar motor switch protein FliN [Bacillota bacterium]
VDSLVPPAAVAAVEDAAPALLELEPAPSAPPPGVIPHEVRAALEGLDTSSKPSPGTARNSSQSRAQPTPAVTVQPATFGDLGKGLTPGEVQNIELLMDVPLLLTVELGRARRQIREVLNMGPGSVIELDRLAGEAVDVLINGKLVAKGEVVVIDENFGVRITDIVSPAERVRGL